MRSNISSTPIRRELDRVALGGVGDLGGELADVVALVAALGHVLAARAGADRLAELLDLGAGVVEVVLARTSWPENSSSRASASP